MYSHTQKSRGCATDRTVTPLGLDQIDHSPTTINYENIHLTHNLLLMVKCFQEAYIQKMKIMHHGQIIAELLEEYSMADANLLLHLILM